MCGKSLDGQLLQLGSAHPSSVKGKIDRGRALTNEALRPAADDSDVNGSRWCNATVPVVESFVRCAMQFTPQGGTAVSGGATNCTFLRLQPCVVNSICIIIDVHGCQKAGLAL